MWDGPSNAQSSWAGWHLDSSSSYKSTLIELMLWRSFNIWSFLNQPCSMDFNVSRSDLQYIFPVDKFMCSFIFINLSNSNLYLCRLIHSRWMLRTVNDNIYHVRSNAFCSGITTDFYLSLPPKNTLILTWAKARKHKYDFSPRWIQFKMPLVQKCLVEFKKLWKQKEEKYNQKVVISWFHLVGRIF